MPHYDACLEKGKMQDILRPGNGDTQRWLQAKIVHNRKLWERAEDRGGTSSGVAVTLDDETMRFLILEMVAAGFTVNTYDGFESWRGPSGPKLQRLWEQAGKPSYEKWLELQHRELPVLPAPPQPTSRTAIAMRYVLIKVALEYDPTLIKNPDYVLNECGYDLSYDGPEGRILSTEIEEISEYSPLDR